MSNLLKLCVVTVLIGLLVGCSEKSVPAPENNNAALQQSTTSLNNVAEGPNNSCNQTWFTKVEQQLTSGDDQGHGPDLGSLEWRSVIEFKLGIRGQATLPAKDTELWCDYINSHYIK
ncbi:hypothetical protein TUM4438_17440 [Shewanella sairae]|uniref:Lipoprotein n=1 Tax=Shewanella sairae TaxID=190310 RepID=A0ABQ4PBS7_9GAMM|nr:hypothetical protein [Shewanella sairae]MCL1129927.1 hypothetical protein [Shewanella sairae]GIU44985.1 hypothetical protein TUM4438_17440 [Shewanella sairae]